jgi:hypothetical protein
MGLGVADFPRRVFDSNGHLSSNSDTNININGGGQECRLYTRLWLHIFCGEIIIILGGAFR